VSPYSCDFGAKWLQIHATVRITDRHGQAFETITDRAMNNATNVTETNKWTTECAPREVSVGRTPPAADERHADVWFAINDAFKHARRRLQDHVRRLQGQVKQHESQPIATVKTIDQSGEFGFLEAADGHEVYFHRNSVLDGALGRRSLRRPSCCCSTSPPPD
jgi:hypothetical protein